ncbi:jacalin-related lectin 3-like [Chenopodium quinoa]|uniref:jacalin-related lectin 3-like n=1 Tax=Chenopodium quinoa TaxID=63459 RepID=UPI000B78FB0B|nr:jacalin-related lectin 3-like [Chenopodium quinoa]
MLLVRVVPNLGFCQFQHSGIRGWLVDLAWLIYTGQGGHCSEQARICFIQIVLHITLPNIEKVDQRYGENSAVYMDRIAPCQSFYPAIPELASWQDISVFLCIFTLVAANNLMGSEVKHIAYGPWGGQSGYKWDDGIYSGVRQFEYDKNGRAIWSDKHGGNNGTRTDQIKLDYPTQYLVSISGFCGSITKGGPVIVRSLSLQTNRKKYGPFGIEQGAPLSLPVNNEMLVGFHGWSSEYLDSIGVYVKSQPQTNLLETHRMLPTTHVRVPGINKKVQSLGPWGGDGGTNFDDGIYTGVREVHIMRSGGLVSIRVCYDQNGKVVWGNKHGGSGGLKLDKIVFDYPYEILTLITGLYGSTILRGPTVVKSLTFHTNKRSYGPFGDPQGFSFSTGSLGAIVGFHGRNGYFVHSLGVHVVESKPVYPHSYPDYDMPNHVLERKPVLAQPYLMLIIMTCLNMFLIENQKPAIHPPYPDHYDMPGVKPSEVVWGMPRQPALYDSGQSGPWGGEGGKSWDDGVYIGVKKIILKRGDAICSIQIQYDEHGHSVWSAPHGIANDACTYHIKFDYPYKVLTSISGSYDILVGDMYRRVIRSLTFHTNKAKYGPYGKPIGTHFSSSNKEGKIVGIHGRSGTFLDAIGVHMQHWVSDELSHQPYSPERGGFTKILNKMYK